MANYSSYFQAVPRPSSDRMAEEFFAFSGRYFNFRKETYFLRYVSRGAYGGMVEKLRPWREDGKPAGRGCLYVPALSKAPDREELENYVARYDPAGCKLPFRFRNQIWQETFEAAFQEALEQFRRSRGWTEESILRNFAVRLLYWIDRYFPRLFVETERIAAFPKFVCGGTVKLPEYLFLCLLYRLGCDVMYLGENQDVSVDDPQLLRLSVRLEGPERAPQAAAAAGSAAPRAGERRPAPSGTKGPAQPAERTPASGRPAPEVRERPAPPSGNGAQPLDYMELAKLAASVVMLKVFDAQGQCFKTGSGVIINGSGYILTNFHVAAGGFCYGVLLEEETETFYTNELIKYNQDLDLAILRMEKRRAPIPVWRGPGALARGQRVVAIGSPLGLFNTVSDGIISGFRTVGERSMIQFTAPTSHGSSGGALLDLYGNLIGIITAGFDDGQNLNLAVDHKAILAFAHGLL